MSMAGRVPGSGKIPDPQPRDVLQVAVDHRPVHHRRGPALAVLPDPSEPASGTQVSADPVVVPPSPQSVQPPSPATPASAGTEADRAGASGVVMAPAEASVKDTSSPPAPAAPVRPKRKTPEPSASE